jgi:hypothetical protein
LQAKIISDWEPAMTHEEDNHGQTLASWSAVIVAILGFLVGSIGVVIASPPTFWVGVALLPVAGLVGKVLALMGFGATQK